MPVTVETAPTVEPVSTTELKAHLRVDSTAEDTYIGSLITAARQRVEIDTGRALIHRTLRLTLDTFPANNVIRLEQSPLNSVTSIKYLDPDGVEQTFSSTLYSVSTYHTPGRIMLKDGESWPETDDDGNAVTILYKSGYSDKSGAPIPSALTLGIMQLAAHWFMHREPVNIGNIVTPIPKTIDYLILPYKVWS